MNILIADDAQMLRQRMLRLLNKVPGITAIHESEDCETTRAAIAKVKPQIVVLDLYMPDGSGLDVLRELSAESVRPLVIVLTTMSDDDIREQCLEAGAEYFFDKASGFFDAVDTVKKLVAGG